MEALDETRPPTVEPEAPIGKGTERRIRWLTPLLGGLAAAGTLIGGYPQWAAGLAIGTGLAWLNFRWLGRGLDLLTVLSAAQANVEKPRVPISTYFFAVFRYALIALAVYVIFKVLDIPLLSMILGLCALGAAAIAASVYEVSRPSKA